MRCTLRYFVVVLIVSLVAAGLWGSDSPVSAQGDCVSEGAVEQGETGLAADCEVLLDVRDTLAGTATLNWAADVPIESWDGIDMSGMPMRVTEIGLLNNGLSGTIPSELGELDGLRGLDLRSNRLTGSIPNELGDLSNLTALILRDNQLTGTIPVEVGNLANLAELDLYNNRLSGQIPTELGNLANLEFLELGANQLIGTIPTQLGNLSNLTELSLWGNELSGEIPAELGSLSNLERLRLGRNPLSGEIPAELGNLSNVSWLYLYDNQLSGEIPPELGSLSNLWGLSIGGNQLTGEIPDSLTVLTRLRRLEFFSNAGLCAPVDDAFQTWLQGVDTVHGSSCAPVDSQEDRAVLANLHSATNGANWENNSNWLSNQPIREWYGVTNDASGRVTGLYLWENQLSGSIPLELGNLANLVALYLRNNQLTGCIPEAVWDVRFNDFDEVGLPFCGVPTVTLSVDSADYWVRIGSPITVTATFSEPVSEFTIDDITVANGHVSYFSGSDGDSVYTFNVSPNAVGVVTVDIAAGVATDADSEVNIAAAQLSLGLPYDDDRDGAIGLAESIAAVSDYFSGNLSLEHAIEIVSLYFASL